MIVWLHFLKYWIKVSLGCDMKDVRRQIKKFIFAMVSCGELPCTISNIAKAMKKPVNSISTSRAQLINKGIIYSVKYKELDFTVPEFDGFIKRLKNIRNG